MFETMRARRQTIVLSREKRRRQHRGEMLFVTTPLEMITRLERDRVSTVVLTGSFAGNRELARFLVESYPYLRVLAGRPNEEPDTYLPAYA